MKKSKTVKSKGIFIILFENAFTRVFSNILMILILSIIFLGIFMSFATLPYFGIFMQQHRLFNENFQEINVYGIADGHGSIEILDENYNVIFPKSKNTSYTAEEVANMLHISYRNAKPIRNTYIQDNIVYTQIVCNKTADYDGWFLLVDENLNYVDSANIPFIKDIYTENDLTYIHKKMLQQATTYKYPFVSKTNQCYTLLIIFDYPAPLLEQQESHILTIVSMVLIMIYVFFLAISIRRISQRFRKPLKRLDKALSEFSNGNYSELIGFKDIKEFATITSTFNDMAIKIKQSEAKNKQLALEKQQLISDISHDLKTPITIIAGYADAICNNKVSNQQIHEYLKKINKKASTLDFLINEFANYSKLDSPNFKLNLETVNLCDVVRNALADNYHFIIDSGFRITIDIPDNHYYCYLDIKHFNRCIENILSNFLKYNPVGTTISVFVNVSKNNCAVTFANNGTPIPETLANKLFHPFVMGEASRNSSNSSGLGLSVVEKIIHMHGGEITYCSNKSFENCFIITLKRHISKP